MLSSFYDHAVRRFQCYTLVFPSDFYSGNKDQRTFTVTGDFLRSVYSDYLRASRLPSPFKLQAPVTVNPTYNIPTTNYSQLNINKIMTADLQTTGVTGEKLTELNKVIEEPSDTFPI